jgi:Fic family protein
MKTPPSTPSYDRLLAGPTDRFQRVWQHSLHIDDSAYLHWEELRHREPPAGLSVEEWWYAHQLRRRGSAVAFDELLARNGKPLRLSSHPRIDSARTLADQRLAGSIAVPEAISINAQSRDRFLVSSLMEEAIHSSLYEGAVSTREAAKELLRSGRGPATLDERMILNNYQAMDRIRQLRGEAMSLPLLLELHRIITDGTLDDPSAAGRLQRPEEPRVEVYSKLHHSAVHTPPPADQLPERMARLIEFANAPDESDGRYVHPLLRSILLHFQLAYDHPFADGNGRTARALFYWSMLRHGYWVTEFISISRLLHRRRGPYERAYQWVESDHQDGTYFVLQQIDALFEAVDELEAYVRRKSEQTAELARLSAGRHELNHRQRALLHHALRRPGARYTHESHAHSHGVSKITARSDLQALVRQGLLTMRREGKKLVYGVVVDLPALLGPTPG